MYNINDKYADNISKVIKHYLLANYNRLGSDDSDTLTSYTLHSYKEYANVPIENLPIVVLIGGTGGSGKSSFIEFCIQNNSNIYEESTIDCCKEVADFMYSKFYVADSQEEINFRRAIIEKSDEYRALLHDLKMAWCKFDDGPNNVVLNQVENRINEDSAFLVFINVREPNQIEHLKSTLQDKYRYIPITMKVYRDTVKDWSNEGDATTENYEYDIVIDNSGSLLHLENEADKFCVAVAQTCIEMSRILKPFQDLNETSI